MIEPTEIDLGPLTLVGLTAQTTQEGLSATSARVWQRVGELELDGRIRHLKEPNVTLECQFDWHPTEEWIYMLGMEVSEAADVPDEAVVREVPGGAWLAFDLPGEIPNVNVVAAWDEMIEWFTLNDRSVPFDAYIQRYDGTTGKAQNLIRL